MRHLRRDAHVAGIEVLPVDDRFTAAPSFERRFDATICILARRVRRGDHRDLSPSALMKEALRDLEQGRCGRRGGKDVAPLPPDGSPAKSNTRPVRPCRRAEPSRCKSRRTMVQGQPPASWRAWRSSNWTATAELDWSSKIAKEIGRPLMPPDRLTIVSMARSAWPSSFPRKAAAPVSGMIALIANGSAARPLRGGNPRTITESTSSQNPPTRM